MKKIVNYLGLVFCMLLMIQPVLADDCNVGPPCLGYADDEPGETCCPVIEAPFDGGITLMLAAGGIGMGVRAMRKRKNSGQ